MPFYFVLLFFIFRIDNCLTPILLVCLCFCCWSYFLVYLNSNVNFFLLCRPTSRGSIGNGSAGIADDQARDFDFEKTEMKYDSTGMFHWSPARSLEDCILVMDLLLKKKKNNNNKTNRNCKCTGLIEMLTFIGSKSSSYDRIKRSRSRMSICRPWLAADWIAQLGDAVTGV